MIKAGANVNNYISSGKTAYVLKFIKIIFIFKNNCYRLMVAASTGFSKACALLIENGANIYSVDQHGKYHRFTK